MSRFLEAVLRQAEEHPRACAFKNSSGESITYGDLDRESSRLARHLEMLNPTRAPIALYGHKEPRMIMAMVAAMKAGMAYVPLDYSFPSQRIQGILEQLDEPVVLKLRPGAIDERCVGSVLEPEAIDALVSTPVTDEESTAFPHAVTGDDVQYILFTSGSTGAPKGVMQKARTIDNFMDYFGKFVPEGEGLAFFNRAPFSFDVSCFDIVTALPHGHAMFSLDEEAEKSLSKAFEAFGASGLSLWFSTPSFLDMCLVDPGFNAQLLPQVKRFVLCGEVLRNKTAQLCFERFPDAEVVNSYGPTETQAVTDVTVTPAMAIAEEPLPIGYAGPGNSVMVVDRETDEPCAPGEAGEVVVLGDQIAAGYYRRPDLTEKVFGERLDYTGVMRCSYRTGDEGYLDNEGDLHYIGRFDLQVKVNGYRIELGEVEDALAAQPEVAMACVVTAQRQGVNVALTAHVVCAPGTEGTRELTKHLKEALKQRLPEYMIPRTVKYHDSLPVNTNGKIDRKALAQGAEKKERA